MGCVSLPSLIAPAGQVSHSSPMYGGVHMHTFAPSKNRSSPCTQDSVLTFVVSVCSLMMINTQATDIRAILGILGKEGDTIRDSTPITQPEKNCVVSSSDLHIKIFPMTSAKSPSII